MDYEAEIFDRRSMSIVMQTEMMGMCNQNMGK